MKRTSHLIVISVLVVALGACGSDPDTALPRCEPTQRLGTVAQSVPTASFVPCITRFEAGWHATSFEVQQQSTRFTLQSDRDEHDVDIAFRGSCDIAGATPIAPRDDGVRTSLRLDSVTPRYAGQMFDAFPGGCVSYEFDFARGAHITLLDELLTMVGLYPRVELRQELRRDFDLELDG